MESKMRRFQLYRKEDESGISGTGIVAEGIEFTSGMVAITWHSQYRAVNIYENIKTVVALHGHNGKTEIRFIDE